MMCESVISETEDDDMEYNCETSNRFHVGGVQTENVKCTEKRRPSSNNHSVKQSAKLNNNEKMISLFEKLSVNCSTLDSVKNKQSKCYSCRNTLRD